MLRPLFLLLLIVALHGCAAHRAAEDCAACTPRGARAGIRFQRDAWLPGGDTSGVLTVMWTEPSGRGTSRSTEWSGDARFQWSRFFPTAARDSVRATGILRSAAGDTLAAVGIALPLRDDWWWGLRWDVMPLSTLRSFGELNHAMFRDFAPLRGEEGAADPLVLVLRYGGRGIKRPMVH